MGKENGLNIAVMAVPDTGHSNPTYGMIENWVQSGHNVFVWTHELQKPSVLKAGAQFRDYKPGVPHWHPVMDHPEFDGQGSAHRYCEALASVAADRFDDYFAELKELQIDFVFYDPFALWGKALAIALQVPAICSITTTVMMQETEPWMPEFQKFKMNSPIVQEKMAKLHSKCEILKELLPIEELFFAHSHQYNIVYTCPEFQNRFDLVPQNLFHYIGPSLTDRVHPEFPFEKIRELKGPIVYVSLGTVVSMFWKDDAKIVFEHLANSLSGENFVNDGLQPVSVVMATMRTEMTGVKLPSNVISFSSVPQLKILQHHANVFVTHCGMNSSMEGLYYKVPMVSVPLFGDQPANAKKLEELGCCIRVAPTFEPHIGSAKDLVDAIDGKVLRQSINRVLEERENFAANLEKLNESLKKCGGPSKAAKDVVDFVRSQKK